MLALQTPVVVAVADEMVRGLERAVLVL